MTNKIAVWLFFIIVLAIALDLYMGWGGMLYLMRKFVDLIEVFIFWR